ncbi:MAG TPA: DinB family protein [Vicinamibacterales bacterium]
MPTEIDDLREHFDRYRAVTLQHLERLADEQLSWRPRPDAFSCGQHFVHLVQTEDFYMRGLFQHDWDPERLRFPKALPRKAELREQLDAVRQFTLNHFATLTSEQLTAIVPPILGSTVTWSLRSWLWYVLEHEVHHKAQLAEYLRQIGTVPPFFAFVLPDGQRPDIKARADLGGI